MSSFFLKKLKHPAAFGSMPVEDPGLSGMLWEAREIGERAGIRLDTATKL